VSRLALLLSLVSSAAWAQRAFPFTWDSATLEPGTREVQAWVTPRLGRVDTGYTQLDVRFQQAQGLSAQVEMMFGLDLDLISFAIDSRDLEAHVSSTWRYSLLRSSEVVGLAVLGRFALGLDDGELEVRLVLDKQFGRLLLALNASASRTVRWGSGEGIDTRLEQSFGARYQVQAEFSAGLEVRSREAWQRSVHQGTAWSAGPTFTYASKRWWVALGLMAQAGANKARADRGNGEPLELRDNERFTGRVVLGLKTD